MCNSENIYIGENIKYLAFRNNLSQKKFGEIIGISAISNYTSGRNFPSIHVLVKIAKHFNISLDDLVLKDLRSESIKKATMVEEDREAYMTRKFKEYDAFVDEMKDLLWRDRGGNEKKQPK